MSTALRLLATYDLVLFRVVPSLFILFSSSSISTDIALTQSVSSLLAATLIPCLLFVVCSL